ncbi:MAG: isochorismate lyase [Pedobacter sp.]|nr:MAG: isochorismate lyase [Pedobacter sp.]
MIHPEDCANMQEIRAEIDHLDQTIISLIGKRYQYVKAAAKFKTSETTVKAPDRFASMLVQRRAWAKDQGLNPDVIAKIYTDLVNYFINEEMEHWKSKS